MKRNTFVKVAICISIMFSIGMSELNNEEMLKIDKMVHVLNLNGHQRKKIIRDRKKGLKKLFTLEKRWAQLHDRLQLEVRKRKPNKKEIVRLSKKIGSIEGEIVLLRTNSLVYLKSLLTDDQIDILENGP